MIFGKCNEVPINLTGRFNSEKYANQICLPIMELLNDDIKCEEAFVQAAEILASTKIDLHDKQLLKSTDVTYRILEIFRPKQD
jgi:hypothetical protein